MHSVPLQGLDLFRHAAEQGGVVPHDVLVDLSGERLVVGMGSEIALLKHLEPVVGFLSGWDEILGKGLFKGRTGSAAFVPLAFEVEFKGLPDDFKGELEALDGGIADEFAFRLSNGFGEARGARAHVGLSLGESFFAHGLKFSDFKPPRIAVSCFAESAN